MAGANLIRSKKVNNHVKSSCQCKQFDTEIENAILKAAKTERPFGTETFIDEMEFSLNMPLRPKRPGRPCKG